jgi:FtsH-binding integral membrane protein
MSASYPDTSYGPARHEYVADRSAFVLKTYLHLFGAIGVFTLLEVFFFTSGVAQNIMTLIPAGQYGWLAVLGAFMVVSWLASRAAHTATSLAAQYAALGLFVLAWALIFVPLLAVANAAFPGAIQSAVLVTLTGFTGLTAVAFITRKDFSFLRGVLFWGGVCALLLIVASVVFGFTLGTIFMVAMIAFAGTAILYDTSNILLHYSEDRYVGAALALFASVALMFWYVLRLFINRD